MSEREKAIKAATAAADAATCGHSDFQFCCSDCELAASLDAAIPALLGGLLGRIEADEREMAFVQGESGDDHLSDYSRGHWNGARYGRREAAKIVRAALEGWGR